MEPQSSLHTCHKLGNVVIIKTIFCYKLIFFQKIDDDKQICDMFLCDQLGLLSWKLNEN